MTNDSCETTGCSEHGDLCHDVPRLDAARGRSKPPGPPDPPLIPGHLGAPSYEECAGMLLLVSVSEATNTALPPSIAFQIGPWVERVKEWGRREIDRGNLDQIVEAMGRV